MPNGVEQDVTVQAFTQWLTELRAKSTRTVQEMLSEVSVIRDSITSNNVELTDFKRHSTGISQEMQSQLTDLREKLTNAFGEITSLVRQKTSSDQEMMQDIHWLQQNLSSKSSELEALKKSYSQAHQQLQSSLIQIQNHLQVTQNEVATGKIACDRVYRHTTSKFTEIDENIRTIEDQLSSGNAESRTQMSQLHEEIGRIRQSLSSVNAEFLEHKRATSATHNRLQSQVWSVEEAAGRPSIAASTSPYGVMQPPATAHPAHYPQHPCAYAPSSPAGAVAPGVSAAHMGGPPMAGRGSAMLSGGHPALGPAQGMPHVGGYRPV